MGHTSQQRKWRIRCAKCGEHEYGKCNKDAKLKCCNCGSEHSAAYAGSVVQKQAEEIQIVNKVSYEEAVKSVGAYEIMQIRPTEPHGNESDNNTCNM